VIVKFCSLVDLMSVLLFLYIPSSTIQAAIDIYVKNISVFDNTRNRYKHFFKCLYSTLTQHLREGFEIID
jgi:hypothetical protein